MESDGAVQELHRICRSFGPGAARAKAGLLHEIASGPRPGRRARSLLAEAAEFLRAYPDDPEVLRFVEAIIPLLPPTDVSDTFAYGSARRLLRLLSGSFDIDWDGFDEKALLDALRFLVLPGEIEGLDDTRLTLQEWFAHAKPAGTGDLEYLIGLLERSGLPEPLQSHLFDACRITLRYRGPRISEVRLPGKRRRYQRRAIARDSFPLASYIRKPAGRSVRAGAAVLHTALRALGARNLEIYPLVHGNAADVTLTEAGRGVRIARIGVEPAWRQPLEAAYFLLVFKNGVPVAYGPAAVFGGACEMGINLFPEFRGGETRYLYGQLMRVFHHALGAELFFLTRYGMGEDNKDAIQTGAFWFYRKLGFRPTNAEVETLAVREEALRAVDPAHRSDRRMLRRLSRTEAHLDLSGGRCRPVDFGRLALAESRWLGQAAGGDGRRAAALCAARLGRILGVDQRARAVRSAAPSLCLIPDLHAWPRRDREMLARFLRAKDGSSEAKAARLSARLPRLAEALRQAAGSGPL
jgi:hypothetical protein